MTSAGKEGIGTLILFFFFLFLLVAFFFRDIFSTSAPPISGTIAGANFEDRTTEDGPCSKAESNISRNSYDANIYRPTYAAPVLIVR